MLYEAKTPLNTFGSEASFGALGAPPGVAINNQVAELLRDLALQLQLSDIGVVTPWAVRKSDLDWEEVQDPSTNVALFGMDDAKLRQAVDTVLFGQQLPFVAVLTGHLQPTAEIERILNGSSYELFQTDAVYRQDDPDPVPQILFLHWLRLRDVEDIPTRNVKPMGQVASDLFGSLVFAQQVPVEGSKMRGRPPIPFAEAFGIQEPDPLAPESEVTTTVDPELTEEVTLEPVQQQQASVSYVGPLLVGAACAVATVAFMQARKKR